jgi:hypothetical protein
LSVGRSSGSVGIRQARECRALEELGLRADRLGVAAAAFGLHAFRYLGHNAIPRPLQIRWDTVEQGGTTADFTEQTVLERGADVGRPDRPRVRAA